MPQMKVSSIVNSFLNCSLPSEIINGLHLSIVYNYLIMCILLDRIEYSGTLECDHPGNLTTLLIRPHFDRPVLVFYVPNGHGICPDCLDKVTTFLIWPVSARPKSGPIIKVPL